MRRRGAIGITASAVPSGAWWRGAWLLLLFLVAPWAHAGTPYPLFGPAPMEPAVATYHARPGEPPPQGYSELPAWLASRQAIPRISMYGGDYWLVASLPPTFLDRDWVVTFSNSYYHQASLYVLGDDGTRQSFDAGRGIDTNFMLRGLAPVNLQPGHRYAVVIRVTTPFFTAPPRVDLQTREHYRRRLTSESALMLLSLGVLCGLGVFILFVGLWTRNASYALYGCQSLILMAGWASFFGLPEDWLGIRDGRFNFTLWFILVPVVHAPFTIRFLELARHAPRAARIGYGIAIASLAALPVSLVLPSFAFLIATIAITSVVLFSASCGLWALLNGIRQARFFALAYVCVLVPGAVILPVNFGLMASPVDNADLLTLIGNSCEAMLLAFALADHVKLVQAARERFRQGMLDAVARASTDPLTGLGNRLAFDMRIDEIVGQAGESSTPGSWQIAVIDLDGLKQINDSEGHARGDALLQAAANGLAALPCDGRAFRLGGDEFAVIAFGDELAMHRLTRALIRLDEQLAQHGFSSAGLSFGVCRTAEGNSPNSAEFAALVRQADHLMYEHKSRRRTPSIGANEAPDPASQGDKELCSEP